MTMLGISEANITEHHEGQQHLPPIDELYDTDGVRINYNQTNPDIISDGIDSLFIIETADDQYDIYYWGYRVGHLQITRDGIRELGQYLLGDRDRIPSWLFDTDTVTKTSLPWWVPDELTINPHIDCQQCSKSTPADTIITPERRPPDVPPQLCTECWEEVR